MHRLLGDLCEIYKIWMKGPLNCWEKKKGLRQSKLLPKLNTSHTKTGVEELCFSLQHGFLDGLWKGRREGSSIKGARREQVNAVCSMIPV